MVRLIDAEITAKALEEYLRINRAPMHYQNQFWCEGMEDAERIVSEQPTVDAVPVIRCKDCKYYQQGSRNSDDWLWCMMNHHYTDEEKYCAWAEMKEE